MDKGAARDTFFRVGAAGRVWAESAVQGSEQGVWARRLYWLFIRTKSLLRRLSACRTNWVSRRSVGLLYTRHRDWYLQYVSVMYPGQQLPAERTPEELGASPCRITSWWALQTACMSDRRGFITTLPDLSHPRKNKTNQTRPFLFRSSAHWSWAEPIGICYNAEKCGPVRACSGVLFSVNIHAQKKMVLFCRASANWSPGFDQRMKVAVIRCGLHKCHRLCILVPCKEVCVETGTM